MTQGFILLVASLATAPIAAQGTAPTDTRSDLRILLVGHDPADPYVNYEPTKKMVAMHAERTGSFTELLNKHFHDVRVVFAKDYEVAMSSGVDVTILDAKPPVVVEANGETSYFDQLLPGDFRRPVLSVGEVSADVGLGLNLKIDWL